MLSDKILTIDPATGDTALVGATGLIGSTSDLHFDAEGNLFGVKSSTQSENILYAIDRVGGAGAVIGSTGFRDITTLAFRPEKLEGRHLSLSTKSLDFKTVFTGSASSTRTVTIYSIGTAVVTIANISASDSAFSLSNLPSLPAVIPPGGTLSFAVTFSPASTGIITSAILITSDDSDDSVQTILLRGEGFLLTPARSDIWYAAANSSKGAELITLDSASVAGTLIGPTGLKTISSLAINSKGIILGADGSTTGDLYFIDARTGAATLAASTGLSQLGPITFDENDVLYGISGSGLFTIDLKTETKNFINSLSQIMNGLAFDHTEGTLWASAGDMGLNVDGILTIDTTTGEATLIGKTGLGGGTDAIAFDAKGKLFGIKKRNSAESILISIDKSTGVGTVIGATGFRNVSGLVGLPKKLEGQQLSVKPNAIDFSSVLVDSTSLPKVVILKSIGTEAVTINEISVPGGAFRLDSLPMLPVVLLPGKVISFEVKFSPADSGIVTSAVTIRSDDIDNSLKTISLTGEGIKINLTKPGACYATARESGSYQRILIAIDPVTGTGIPQGRTSLNQITALAVNSHGLIFGIESSTGKLYIIDAVSAKSTFLADTKITDVTSIAFDENDILYGVIGTNLYTIDTKSGKAALFGFTQLAFSGLDFDPLNGTMWASRSSGFPDEDGIHIIDRKTRASELIGKTGLGGGTPAIGFDANGNLFGVKGSYDSDHTLISIDKSNATGTVIGRIGFREVRGLAFSPVGLEGPHFSVRPDSINLGNVLVDSTSYTSSIIIRSIGTEAVSIKDIALSDGPFSLSGLPSMPVIIVPGESQSFEVRFSPPDTGLFFGSVKISSDDVDDPTKNIQLHGRGLALNLAKTGTLYASTGSADGGRLITVNPSTGAGTFAASTNLGAVANLAINSQGVIYCTDGRTGSLYFMDAVKGFAFLAASTDLPMLDALAFDKKDVLFASSSGKLYTIDSKSGKATLIGPTEPFLDDLAFDPTDDKLWASKGGYGIDADKIFIIDSSTGQARLVGKTGLGVNTPAIGFDAKGNLLGISVDSRGENVLFAIDKSTGAGAIIGKIGFRDIRGLAFAHGKITAVANRSDLTSLPNTFVLEQNYPNPFSANGPFGNPETQIRYGIPKRTNVTLRIYNLFGQVVATLVEGEQAAGTHIVTWNGLNSAGARVSSGIYFYKLETKEFTQVRKLLLAK